MIIAASDDDAELDKTGISGSRRHAAKEMASDLIE